MLFSFKKLTICIILLSINSLLTEISFNEFLIWSSISSYFTILSNMSSGALLLLIIDLGLEILKYDKKDMLMIRAVIINWILFENNIDEAEKFLDTYKNDY